MDLIEITAAIQQGDAARVRQLLAADPALLAARTPQGVSLVSLSCYFRRSAIAAILIEFGAVLDLFDACAVGDLDRVRALLQESPASVNAYSSDGFYPLGLAAFFGHRSLAEFLLDSGADVNQQASNSFKVAPIHAAVVNGDIATVKLLLDRGANPNARQQNDYTALRAAVATSRQDIANLLLSHGAVADA
jgi:ankyrin repeat protein